jgi:photosystem II stability/assembly factor-like uncharacterized protein
MAKRPGPASNQFKPKLTEIQRMKKLIPFVFVAGLIWAGMAIDRKMTQNPLQRGENPGYFQQWFNEKKNADGVIPQWQYAAWDAADKRKASLRTGINLFDTLYELGPNTTGGRTRALMVDRRNDNIILAGGISGGLWRSENGGSSWTPLNDHQTSLMVSCIVQSPFDSDVIYYGTGEARANSAGVGGDGIFKSTDGGKTFTQLPGSRNLNGMESVWAIDHSLTDTNTLYAGTDKALYRSQDAGATWQAVYNNARVSDVMCRPDGGVLFTRISTGVYSSPNGNSGTYQIVVDSDIPAQGAYGRIEFDYCRAFPNVVYALFEGPGFSSNATAFMKSSDGGKSWIRRTVPTAIGSGYQTYCVMLGVAYTDSNRVVTGGVNIAGTSNGGSTWNTMSNGHADHHVVANMNQTKDNFLVGNDGGVYRYRWSNLTAANVGLNRGYRTTQFYAGGFAPTGIVSMGGTQDNGTHMATGNLASSKVYGADGGYAHIGQQDGTIAYFATQNDGIFRIDNFRTPSQFIVRITSDSFEIEGVNFINAYQMNPADQYQLFYRTNSGIHFTQDGGDSWKRITRRIVNLKAIGIEAAKNPTVYYGGTSGSLWRADSILTKGFFREVNLSSSIPANIRNESMNYIQVHPKDKYTVYVCYTNNSNEPRIWKASNLRGTPQWTNVSGDLPVGLPVNFIQCDPMNPDSILVAATDFGLYVSNNGGRNWEKEMRVPNVAVHEVKFREDGTVFIYTHGRGLYVARMPRSYTWSVNEPALAKRNLTVYPNPARDQMRIELPDALPTEVTVFSLDGRSMYRRQHTGGSIQLQTTNWPAGHYIVSARSEKGTLTQKLLVTH